jgi:hypothetical protein
VRRGKKDAQGWGLAMPCEAGLGWLVLPHDSALEPAHRGARADQWGRESRPLRLRMLLRKLFAQEARHCASVFTCRVRSFLVLESCDGLHKFWEERNEGFPILVVTAYMQC